MRRPNLPIPEPLRGVDCGSFSQDTVVVRLPKIVHRVLAENRFSDRVVKQLESLIEEIPSAPLRSLYGSGAPDIADWDQYLDPYPGLNWLQIPWFLAETYLYRRILEATGYFDPGEGYRVDPYRYQKQQGLEITLDAIADLSTQLSTWIKQPDKIFDNLAALFTINLWGNQADLSLWPAGQGDQPQHANLAASLDHIVVNDTGPVVDYLANGLENSWRLDFIIDNAGFELVCDLALTDYFLNSSLASRVVLHVKFHPTFVSDATVKDVEQTIKFLTKSVQADTKALGQRLQAHLDTNRLRLQDDLFWTSPLSFWEMPDRMGRELARSDLIISKGDANYRRLLGDRHWPYTTPFADIVSYLPAALVAIRTLKSEVAAGLEPEQIKLLADQDPNWLTNGRRGVIQFAR